MTFRVGCAMGEVNLSSVIGSWLTSPKGKAVVIVFSVLGVVAIVGSWVQRNNAKSFLRHQFRLDDSVTFTSLQPGSGKIHWPSISGVVAFDAHGFDRYVRDLNSAQVWTPRHFDYRDVADPIEYDADAFRWQTQHFLPRYAGDRLLRWGIGIHYGVYDKTKALNFCFALVKDEAAAPRPDGKVPHRGVSCASVRRDQEPTAFVKGRLDMENRRLFMIVI